jgi:hypothetical protein
MHPVHRRISRKIEDALAARKGTMSVGAPQATLDIADVKWLLRHSENSHSIGSDHMSPDLEARKLLQEEFNRFKLEANCRELELKGRDAELRRELYTNRQILSRAKTLLLKHYTSELAKPENRLTR